MIKSGFQLHSVETMESFQVLTTERYTNVFLLVCPEESWRLLDEFRGCNRLTSRVIDVVESFKRNPVVDLRFGVAVTSASAPLAKNYGIHEAASVLYARKNAAGETFVTQFVGRGYNFLI